MLRKCEMHNLTKLLVFECDVRAVRMVILKNDSSKSSAIVEALRLSCRFT